jgi:N4-gp56 family major capsid protein
MSTGAMYTAGYGLSVTLSTVDTNYGRFYGSTKDIGVISGKIPALSETGGRVNRVGMRRIELEGSINKFGFFTEYTQDSLNFDSDSELLMHLTQEVVKAANEMTEDQIQIDLLNGAGVIRYPSTATSLATIDGNSATYANNGVVTYDDLVKLSIELDQNRCPKNTKLITGSRMVDTKVINAARYIYVGSEILPTLMRMTDYHGNKAFIPVAQYAQAGNVAKGEVGAIDSFRFIVVPEMMHYAASGASVTNENPLFRNSSNASGVLKFDVFPMLVVGDGSFTTIGFQTDGKTVKFKTKHVKPEQNYSTDDPYGETGFYSVKWFYGLMILRPERLAKLYTLAEW